MNKFRAIRFDQVTFRAILSINEMIGIVIVKSRSRGINRYFTHRRVYRIQYFYRNIFDEQSHLYDNHIAIAFSHIKDLRSTSSKENGFSLNYQSHVP